MVKGGKASSQPAKAAASNLSPNTRPDPQDHQSQANCAQDKLQQKCLNIFRDSCKDSLNSLKKEKILQHVKGHLFNRDFASAFSKKEYLQPYAARWSPSRALAYAQIFSDVQIHVLSSLSTNSREKYDGTSNPKVTNTLSTPADSLDSLAALSLKAEQTLQDSFSRPDGKDDATQLSAPLDCNPPAYETENPPPYDCQLCELSQSERRPLELRLACLGGGAGAELVGLASWLHSFSSSRNGNGSAPLRLDVTCIDVADWAPIVQDLRHHITAPPVLSRFASSAVNRANSALLPETSFKSSFHRLDLLDLSSDACDNGLNDPHIVTLMFTLNELYSTSMSKTQRLLFQLTAAIRPRSFLLVVDSPGSYSTVTINGAEKRYPMQWLLDHTLLQVSTKTGVFAQSKQWEKVLGDESRWFRLPRELKYPIPLEDMRYQIHLYRRCEPEDAEESSTQASAKAPFREEKS